MNDKCCLNPNIVYLKLRQVNGLLFCKSACLNCGTNKAIKKNLNVKYENEQNSLILIKKASLKIIEIREEKAKKELEKVLKDKEKELYISNYMDSKEWKCKRKIILERDSFICQRCKNIANVVHHITYANYGNEYLYELVSLCYDCHDEIHKKEKIQKYEIKNH